MSQTSLELSTRDLRQLAAHLRRFRKLQKLSQAEVGEKAGLPQTTVSKIEQELINPSAQTLFKLISALDLELVVRPRQRSRVK